MNYLLWLHECRSYVYCGKLIEDDRNDLTLSYANSGLFFFYLRDLDLRAILYIMYNLHQ